MEDIAKKINQLMQGAVFEKLSDGTWWGNVPECPGAWANEETLEKCKKVLAEVVEDWLLLE